MIRKWYFHTIINIPLFIAVVNSYLVHVVGCSEYRNFTTERCYSLIATLGFDLRSYLDPIVLLSMFTWFPLYLFVYIFLLLKLIVFLFNKS